MIDKDIYKLIQDVIRQSDSCSFTDWLFYCLLKSSNINVLDNKEITIQKSIKSGIPCVGMQTIVDTESHRSLLEQKTLIICIETIKDINIDLTNFNFVNIEVEQIFILFDSPHDFT